ncbi:choline O-acetyltransferase-like, partial [Amphibalanus amphitrite]|uniref:choline O-acetyltransferase-like n=1 Tax=Amphibalanus amphitrite TaxID=1232801 RepID=UPI001C907104
DELNAEALTTIENCLFVVCLDDPLPTSFNGRKRLSFDGGVSDGRDDTAMAHQALHGGGTLYNTANRWFDKTIQLIVSPDGMSGLCYEHSAAEGIAVVQLMEQLVAAADRDDVTMTAPTRQLEAPYHIEWFPNDGIKQRIDTSSEAVDRLIDDLDFLVLRFPEYGKNFIKSVRCSPDAYLQLALQLAYYRSHDELVATYESASIRRFRQGRVDNIRAVTPQALAWVKAMDDVSTTRGERVQLFRAALQQQTEIMVENILGQGIDLHLLGLQEMAKELGMKEPELFRHETYRIANHFGLSTSQVPTKSGDTFMGYGAVVPDGYGCSYNPQPDSITFCIGSFHACDMTSSETFANSITESLNMMHDLLKSDTWTSDM